MTPTWYPLDENDALTDVERQVADGLWEMSQNGAGTATVSGRDEDGHLVHIISLTRRATETMLLVVRAHGDDVAAWFTTTAPEQEPTWP